MFQITAPLILASTLITTMALLVSPACTDSTEPDGPPQAGELRDSTQMHTILLDVTLPEHTPSEQIHAIAQSAEALAGADVVGTKVQAKQEADGPTILEIEMWGPEIEAANVLIANLRAEYPELVDTLIVADERVGAPAEHVEVAGHEDETPAQTKARITEELREQGVKGDIQVDVVDAEHGRRVEVEVHEGVYSH